MSSNPYVDADRDDLVGELSFGEMSAKFCNNTNTTVELVIPPVEIWKLWYSDNGGCLLADVGLRKVRVALGDTVYFNDGTADGCTGIKFGDLTKCDAGYSVANCDYGVERFDGTVNLKIP